MTSPTTRPPQPALDPAVWRALGHGHTIDITTIGRQSGEPRRIEMMFHNFDGRLYIAARPKPGTSAPGCTTCAPTPAFTFHLKQLVKADLPATAREITDPSSGAR